MVTVGHKSCDNGEICILEMRAEFTPSGVVLMADANLDENLYIEILLYYRNTFKVISSQTFGDAF